MEIITPPNAPRNIYNFILKNLLHVSALLGHLQGACLAFTNLICTVSLHCIIGNNNTN
jgi:hypothetical protein